MTETATGDDGRLPPLKHRSMRVEDELWDRALVKAAHRRSAGHRGETVSGVLRQRLAAYVEETDDA